MSASPSLCVQLSVAVAAAAFSAGAHAQSVTWPAAAPPCNGTLQACIDAQPAGTEVRIDSDAPTNLAPAGTASVVVGRAIRLVAAPGRRPVLPAGFGIEIPARVDALERPTVVSGLTLRNGGHVRIDMDESPGSASVEVSRMRFEHGTGLARGVVVANAREAALDLRITDNDFVAAVAGRFVEVETRVGIVTGHVSFNRILGQAPGDHAVLARARDGGRYQLFIAANRVVGDYPGGALAYRHEGGSGVQPSALALVSNLVLGRTPGSGTGIALALGEAQTSLLVSGNTVLHHGRGIAIEPRNPSPATPGSVAGTVANNLVAWNGTGVVLAPIASPVVERNNLYFGNAIEATGFSPGAGTVRADPRLVDPVATPWPKPGSPLIDAGTSNALYNAGIFPWLDVDGHRRVKGVAPDIGAFEYGDAWLPAVATAANRSENFFTLDHPDTNGQSLARVFATPSATLGGTTNDRPFGVWWNAGAGRMSLFNQDLAEMPVGAGYQVFVPAPNNPSITVPDPLARSFVVRAGSPPSPTLDLPSSFDGRPDLVILVTQNWNPQDPPASAGVYNDALATVRHEAGRWRIANAAGGPIPAGAAFNVYVQPPSPTAFQLPVGGRSTFAVIDHPMLNGVPCARILLTAMADNAPHDLVYAGVPGAGQWRIRRNAVTPWPAAARFHVLFSPRQVVECAGSLLFRDGFE